MVCTAHCDCMAGLGEACTHIATLLFAIDATVKIRDSKTVTQEPAYWLLPSALKDIKYRPVGEIDFTSAQTKRLNLDHSIATGTPVACRIRQPKEIPAPSANRLDKFLQGLSIGRVKPAVLSVIEPFNDHFIPQQAQNIFPDVLSDMFQEELYMQPYNIILQKCTSVNISATREQIEATEMATRGQSNSRLWQRYRAGRITASKFRKVCKTDPSQPSPSLIKDICYPEKKNVNTPATRWGLLKERKAKEQYLELMKMKHVNFKMRDSGFVISEEHPQIGASPDGCVPPVTVVVMVA
ncbi:uncharacterized protein LOC121366854 [Gigantopelta aegis]|uniref:uncharacterized protein LOC121366854 n=1 Tax=Gigantopelta aegis TaxID=1735272 RepID=UPI001B88D2C3|nr:uncharacterized protein LOC121366854 [Gigantopelta aegis]